MLKRLPVVLALLLLAGCGMTDPAHQTAPQPLTQAELESLPSAEIGRRIALQLGLTVADDPNINGRYGFSERKRLHDIILQNQGYEEGDGLCRRDLLTVAYGRRTSPAMPAKPRGFWSEPTFARLKDFPGVADCADSRLVFFRVLPRQFAFPEEVARRSMTLFDLAHLSATPDVLECDAIVTKSACLEKLKALPVSHIMRIYDCEPDAEGACAAFTIDDWDLRIQTKADGRLSTVGLFKQRHL